jgi:hypothetical protein
MVHNRTDYSQWNVQDVEKMSDNILVHMLKAGKTFEGTTREVCDAIGKEIDEDIGK